MEMPPVDIPSADGDPPRISRKRATVSRSSSENLTVKRPKNNDKTTTGVAERRVPKRKRPKNSKYAIKNGQTKRLCFTKDLSSRCVGKVFKPSNRTNLPTRFWLRHVGVNESVIDTRLKIAVLNDRTKKINLKDCKIQKMKVYIRWDIFSREVLRDKIKLKVLIRRNGIDIFANSDSQGRDIRQLTPRTLRLLPSPLKNIFCQKLDRNPSHFKNQWAVLESIDSGWRLEEILMGPSTKDDLLDPCGQFEIIKPPESFIKLSAGVRKFKVQSDTDVFTYKFPENIGKNQCLVVLNINSNQAKIPGLSQPLNHEGLKSALRESDGRVFRSDGVTVLPLGESYVAFPARCSSPSNESSQISLETLEDISSEEIDSSDEFVEVINTYPRDQSRSFPIRSGLPPKVFAPETYECTLKSRMLTEEERRLRRLSNFAVIPMVVKKGPENLEVDMSHSPCPISFESLTLPPILDEPLFLDIPPYKYGKVVLRTEVPFSFVSPEIYCSKAHGDIALYPSNECIRFVYPLDDNFWVLTDNFWTALRFFDELSNPELSLTNRPPKQKLFKKIALFEDTKVSSMNLKIKELMIQDFTLPISDCTSKNRSNGLSTKTASIKRDKICEEKEGGTGEEVSIHEAFTLKDELTDISDSIGVDEEENFLIKDGQIMDPNVDVEVNLKDEVTDIIESATTVKSFNERDDPLEPMDSSVNDEKRDKTNKVVETVDSSVDVLIQYRKDQVTKILDSDASVESEVTNAEDSKIIIGTFQIFLPPYLVQVLHKQGDNQESDNGNSSKPATKKKFSCVETYRLTKLNKSINASSNNPQPSTSKSFASNLDSKPN